MSIKHLSFKIHSVVIQTADFDLSFKFYTRVLGLPVVREPYLYKGERTLAWLDAGRCLIELYSVKISATPKAWSNAGVGPVNLAFDVEDLEAAARWIEANNIRIRKGPFVPPSGDLHQPAILFIAGPDGEDIVIRQKADARALVQ